MDESIYGQGGAPYCQGPCESEIRHELRAVLDSRHFADTPVCRQHLAYLVEKALRGDAPEQFSEADVFVELIAPKRPDMLPIYDPHVHRVIGVQHCRAKLRIRGWLNGAGTHSAIEIYFENGSLYPRFRYRRPVPPEPGGSGGGCPPALPAGGAVTLITSHQTIPTSR